MTIALQIREDMKNAMKAKESAKLLTLRSLLAAFTSELLASGKTPRDEVTDEMAMTVIKRAAKQRKDSIEQFAKGGRDDLIVGEKAELEVIEAYLPESMTEVAILEIAMTKKAELGVEDVAKMGILVGAVMKETSGNADGGVVKRVVEGLFE